MAPPATVIDTHFESDVATILTNPCNGDLIDYTGHEIVDIHAILNKNRANTSVHAQGRYDGVDASGNTNSGHSSNKQLQNVPADNGAFTISFVFQFHFVGQGSAPNFTIRQDAKLTVNANGDVTVEKVGQTLHCN